jgi:hypothetical protein
MEYILIALAAAFVVALAFKDDDNDRDNWSNWE